MSTPGSFRPKHMGLSNAEGDSEDEYELQGAEQSALSVVAIRAEALSTYVSDAH